MNDPNFNYDFDGDGKLSGSDVEGFKELVSYHPELLNLLTPEARKKLETFLNHPEGRLDEADVWEFTYVMSIVDRVNSAGFAGDFNGDGRPDLAAANRSANNVSVLLANGDGTFQAARNFPAGFGPRSVAVGDVNGDGFGDLIVGASGAEPGGDSSAGEIYVVFGKAGGFAASLDLATLNGANGFRLYGIDASDYSGFSVSGAGAAAIHRAQASIARWTHRGGSLMCRRRPGAGSRAGGR